MKRIEIGLFEAKTRLSEFVRKARDGQVYVITRRGEPLAELRPITPIRRRLVRGQASGLEMSDDFDAPLPEFEEYT